MADETLGMSGAAAAAQATDATRRPSISAPVPHAGHDRSSALLRDLRRRHLLLPLVIVVALVLFVIIAIGGYALGWGWTGFRGNSLWDWFSLLTTPFAISIAGLAISLQQMRNNQRINVTQHQEGILDAYLTEMTHFMLDQQLRESPANSPLRDVARARTRATARRVSQRHREVMVHFLNDFGLMRGPSPVLAATELGDVFDDIEWPAGVEIGPTADASR